MAEFGLWNGRVQYAAIFYACIVHWILNGAWEAMLNERHSHTACFYHMHRISMWAFVCISLNTIRLIFVPLTGTVYAHLNRFVHLYFIIIGCNEA